MYAIGLLWLPIVLSAAAIFVVSSVIHMFSPWHKSDYPRVPDQDRVMDALRPFAIPPGEYMVPRASSTADMRSPEFQAKLKQGPVLMMNVWPNGMMAMGKTMLIWFVYLLIASAAVACLACAVVAKGAEFHRVFHVVAFSSFLAYNVGQWPQSIWYHKPWRVTFKMTVDGTIYAVITGLIFVWLWPAAAAAV